MAKRRGERVEKEFAILRPTIVFDFPYKVQLPQNAWFERHKHDILTQLLRGAVDISDNRMLVANMLLEAWNPVAFSREEGWEKFNRIVEELEKKGAEADIQQLKRSLAEKPPADESDRLFLIGWLQNWATYIGLLSYDEVNKLKELGERGVESLPIEFLPLHYRSKKKIFPPDDFGKVSELTRRLKQSGKVIGMFHGSFDPPTWVHLALMTYYRKFCDHFIVGLDSDELVKARKVDIREPAREVTPLGVRATILRNFPYLFDSLVTLRMKQVDQKQITEDYKDLNVGIVFLAGHDPERRVRERSIRRAGARPFAYDPWGRKRPIFSSTQLMELRDLGLATDIFRAGYEL